MRTPPLPSLLSRAVPSALLGLVLGVTGACGSEEASPAPAGDSSDAPSAGAAGGLPDCADVWAPGATLPARYRGCTEEGVEVPRDALACSSGQTLVQYQDRFAVLGGTVRGGSEPLAQNEEYAASVARCRG